MEALFKREYLDLTCASIMLQLVVWWVRLLRAQQTGLSTTSRRDRRHSGSVRAGSAKFQRRRPLFLYCPGALSKWSVSLHALISCNLRVRTLSFFLKCECYFHEIPAVKMLKDSWTTDGFLIGECSLGGKTRCMKFNQARLSRTRQRGSHCYCLQVQARAASSCRQSDH